MKPGTSREIPSGAGFPKPAGIREKTPGEEAEGGERSSVMMERRGGDEDSAQRETCENPGGTGGDEDELDPRIQAELEQLNQASDQINQLELQLDDARSSYRRVLTDSARRLNAQGHQFGACIEKARPYYEARRLAKEVRSGAWS
ncbi:SH3 domain-binding protein 5-like [Liparis tanakae]|uniref:SH3 domain-binding protein 5 n=1 Tax=Liparis tanakae TaxID=230148 RepID=A0A4Z2E092_9TELE|nr:SH3 domain-binding protein 5-like [Liparis tanakae]